MRVGKNKLQLGNEAAAPFIEKNTVLCMYTETCVKEKLQHNNKVEFVFLRTDGHAFCELVVVPTLPTFAATTSAIRLSKTTAALFFNFTQKLEMTKTEEYTILLIASMAKNQLVGTITMATANPWREIDRDRQKN